MKGYFIYHSFRILYHPSIKNSFVNATTNKKVEGLKLQQEADCLLQGAYRYVDDEDNSLTSPDSQINTNLVKEITHKISLIENDVENKASYCSNEKNESENKSKTNCSGADKIDYKTLNRGISRATDNEHIVYRARKELTSNENTDEEYLNIEIPEYTFILPDFTQFADDFREFLQKDLISISTQTSLEQANRLNWWSGFARRLWPLSTSGDGNCLLHAASLGMWGFHDRLLTLRRALHAFLSQSVQREALWRRWKHQQSELNAQAGLVYSEVEWRTEWNAIVNMASTVPRLRRASIISGKGDTYGNIYESLEEIHVLALAHVLKRPIIVIAETVLKDMNGEALAPIPFGGIYLPLECSPTECYRSPLLLAYDGGHFSALVAMETASTSNASAAIIPLVDSTNELLPIQFKIDPGENPATVSAATDTGYDDSVNLLNEYLEIARFDPQDTNNDNNKNGLFGSLGRSVGNKLRWKLSRSNSTRTSPANKPSQLVLCALLHTDKRHEYYHVMIKNYLQTATERFNQSKSCPPRYGAGRSQFYTEADIESHDKVSQLTPVKPITNNDPTLYLSKSTFYETAIQCQAGDCNFYGNPQYKYYCSKCYQDSLKNSQSSNI